MINWDAFRQAQKERKSKWLDTDTILYDICKNTPHHDDPGKTRAKLLIIGRSYATGVERVIPTNNRQGGSIEKLALHIQRKNQQIDAQLERIRPHNGKQSQHFREVVEVHGQLVQILGTICNRSPRSFVSKYMHFHFPFVPIFDSYAQRAISRIVPWNDTVETALGESRAQFIDNEYSRFCKRFWILYEKAIQENPDVLVKELDYYLCYLEDSHRSKSAQPSRHRIPPSV